jgi:hypothetical protein
VEEQAVMTNQASEDFAPVIPYLTVKDGRGTLQFYERAFGAETALVVPIEMVLECFTLGFS